MCEHAYFCVYIISVECKFEEEFEQRSKSTMFPFANENIDDDVC